MAHMEGRRGAYRILVARPDEKRSVGTPGPMCVGL